MTPARPKPATVKDRSYLDAIDLGLHNHLVALVILVALTPQGVTGGLSGIHLSIAIFCKVPRLMLEIQYTNMPVGI